MPSVKFGGEEIMVWGCLSVVGFGPLVPVKGIIKASHFGQFHALNFGKPWKQFRDGFFLFQHVCNSAQINVHKEMSVSVVLNATESSRMN